MIVNMGSMDKRIRLGVAIIITILYFTNIITGNLAIVLFALAVVFVLSYAHRIILR